MGFAYNYFVLGDFFFNLFGVYKSTYLCSNQRIENRSYE